MINNSLNHPYIKWQIRDKEVSSVILRSQIEQDNSDTWRELVGKGIDIYKQDSDGFTPLHHALFYGNDDVSQYLISISKIKNYPLINTGCFKLSIVDYAIFRKACSNNTIALLEKKRQLEGAAPCSWSQAIKRMWADPTGLVKLMECSRFPKEEIPQIVKALLKTNLKADSILYNNARLYHAQRQAIELACTKGDLDTTRSILKARHTFALMGCILRLTKEKIDIELKKIKEENPLRNSYGQFILHDPKEGDNYPLHLALQSGNQQLIDFLLNFNKAILHTVDSEGKTPLIIAAEKSLKSTQKIMAKYVLHEDCWIKISLKHLVKPIEAANKNNQVFTEIFLREIVKIEKNMHPLAVLCPLYGKRVFKPFIKKEQAKEALFEKIQILKNAKMDERSTFSLFLTADVINLIANTFLKLENSSYLEKLLLLRDPGL